jgi:hypothetical protein
MIAPEAAANCALTFTLPGDIIYHQGRINRYHGVLAGMIIHKGENLVQSDHWIRNRPKSNTIDALCYYGSRWVSSALPG